MQPETIAAVLAAPSVSLCALEPITVPEQPHCTLVGLSAVAAAYSHHVDHDYHMSIMQLHDVDHKIAVM